MGNLPPTPIALFRCHIPHCFQNWQTTSHHRSIAVSPLTIAQYPFDQQTESNKQLLSQRPRDPWRRSIPCWSMNNDPLAAHRIITLPLCRCQWFQMGISFFFWCFFGLFKISSFFLQGTKMKIKIINKKNNYLVLREGENKIIKLFN